MSLEETLKYNKEKVRLFREVELKKIKKQQRKEKILATFIGISIIAMMVIFIRSIIMMDFIKGILNMTTVTNIMLEMN